MDCLATEYETLVGLDNTYTMNTENKHFPASFRVIGVGHGIENVINEINSFGNVIWSVNKDDKLNGDEIRLSVILAGKEVWKCQTT